MTRVLIVTSEFFPFQSSGINRLNFFKKYLEEQGLEVFVLTTNAESQGLSTDKIDDAQKNIFRAYSLSLFTRRVLSSRRLPIYPKIAHTGKYAVWINFGVNKGKKLIKDKHIDLVLSSFPDFASIDVAEKIAKATSKPLVTDFRDPPYWIYDKTLPSKKVLRCQEIVKRVVQSSTQIITCTEESSNSLKEFYKVPTSFTVINNGYDQDIINEVVNIPNKKENNFEIIHIGSFYNEGRDIKRVIKALVSEYECTTKKLHLRLVGDEPDLNTKNYIKQVAGNIMVTIEPPVPMIKALSIAKNADALLLLQGSRFDRQIPTKIYEYLALNVPIWAVIGSKGATKALLEDYSNNTVYSDYDNQESINKGLHDLALMKASKVNTDKLSRQYQASKLLTLISNVVSSR